MAKVRFHGFELGFGLNPLKFMYLRSLDDSKLDLVEFYHGFWGFLIELKA